MRELRRLATFFLLHRVSIRMIKMTFKEYSLFIAAAAFFWNAANPDAKAQTYWQGGTSDYDVPASWTGVYNNPANPNCANDSGSNNVVLIQPGDRAWQHGDTITGQGAGTSGAYLQTGSTNFTGGGNWFRMAVGQNSVGFYTLSNGLVQIGGQAHVGEGDNSTAVLEIDGGVF